MSSHILRRSIRKAAINIDKIYLNCFGSAAYKNADLQSLQKIVPLCCTFKKLLKFIYTFYYPLHLLLRHARAHRKGQFAISEHLGNWETQLWSVPCLFGIAFLLMRCNRIMNHCADAMLIQMSNQPIPKRAYPGMFYGRPPDVRSSRALHP